MFATATQNLIEKDFYTDPDILLDCLKAGFAEVCAHATPPAATAQPAKRTVKRVQAPK